MSDGDMSCESVSISIVTRNRAQALEELLTHLCAMFALDLSAGRAEILVFDDASTDATTQVCHAHAEAITVERVPDRVGQVESRRRLGRRARGDYLLQLDDDSFPLRTDALDVVRATFRAHPTAGIVAATIFEGQDASAAVLPAEPCRVVADFIGCGVAFRAASFSSFDLYPRFLRGYGAEEIGAALVALDRGLLILQQPALPVRHVLHPAHRDLPRRRGESFANELAVIVALYPAVFVLPAVLWKTVSHLRYNARRRSLRGFLRVQRHLPKHLALAARRRQAVRHRTVLRYHLLRARRASPPEP